MALTQNYVNKDCAQVAGVVRYYMTPFSNLLTATLTSNVVTAITKTVPWKKYDQEPEVANWKYTLTPGAQGNSGYDWEASFDSNGLDTLDQEELANVAPCKMVLIAEMNDGTYWMLGRENGCRMSGDAFDAGTKYEDFIGSKVTFKGRSAVKMKKVDSAIITGLLS
ncbi:MAG TPA: hypothetical protein PKZ75_15015 [Bacteroidia bacterium]|nr:hypothetical protein [Bacteroidia bacterium]